MLETIEAVGYHAALKAARRAGVIGGGPPPKRDVLARAIAQHNERQARPLTQEELMELAEQRLTEIDWSAIQSLPQSFRVALFRRMFQTLRETWGLQ